MSGDIPLLAELPSGNGPKRAHARMRAGLARIARRVAMAALAQGQEDVLLAVYAAGVNHGRLIAGEQTP